MFIMIIGECRARQGILLLEGAHFSHYDEEEAGCRGSGCLLDSLAQLRKLSLVYMVVQGEMMSV